MKELSVLLDVRTLQHNKESRGIDFYIVELLREFKRQGRSVGLLAWEKRPFNGFSDLLASFPICYIPAPPACPGGTFYRWLQNTYLASGREIFSRLAREYDIIHITNPHFYHFSWPILPKNSRALSAALVLTCLDIALAQCPGLWLSRSLGLKWWPYLWGFRFLLNNFAHSDGVVCISQATQTACAQYLGQVPNITSILLGVDERFRPLSAEEAAAFRSRLNLPERYILQVGAMNRNKNHQLIFEALQHLRESGRKPWTYVVAGPPDPDLQRYYAQRFSDIEVRWLGYVDSADLPALYGAAGMMVFPSLYEGFGLPPLESMACGVPVICSDTSSLPEVCTLDGESGVGLVEAVVRYGRTPQAALLLPVEDSWAWARGIECLMSDERERALLISRGLRRAGQLTWENTVSHLWQYYEQVWAAKQMSLQGRA